MFLCLKWQKMDLKLWKINKKSEENKLLDVNTIVRYVDFISSNKSKIKWKNFKNKNNSLWKDEKNLSRLHALSVK